MVAEAQILSVNNRSSLGTWGAKGRIDNLAYALENKRVLTLVPAAHLMPQERDLFESYGFLRSRCSADRSLQRVQNLEVEFCLSGMDDFLKSHARKPRCAPETSQVGYENKVLAWRNTALTTK